MDMIKYILNNETKEKEGEIGYYDLLLKKVDEYLISEDYNSTNLDNGINEIKRRRKDDNYFNNN